MSLHFIFLIYELILQIFILVNLLIHTITFKLKKYSLFYYKNKLIDLVNNSFISYKIQIKNEKQIMNLEET
jgi:hypothetical protein